MWKSRERVFLLVQVTFLTEICRLFQRFQARRYYLTPDQNTYRILVQNHITYHFIIAAFKTESRTVIGPLQIQINIPSLIQIQI
jgi:hypothetical protein